METSISSLGVRDAHIHFLVAIVQHNCSVAATLQYMRDTGWRADARGTLWVLPVPGAGHVRQTTGEWATAPRALEYLQRRLASLAGFILRDIPVDVSVLRLCGWKALPGDGSDLIRPPGHGLDDDRAQPCPICTAPAGARCQDAEGAPIPGIHLGRLTVGVPLSVRHSGQFHAEGGAFLEVDDGKDGKD